MVRVVCIGSLVLAAITVVSGHVIRWKHKVPPADWQTDILESYDIYHERYLSWDCEKQHNTTFFEKCCHPLLQHECIDALEERGCPSSGSSQPSVAPLAISSSEPPKTSSTPAPSQPSHNPPPPVQPADNNPPPAQPAAPQPADNNPPPAQPTPSSTTSTHTSSTHTTTPTNVATPAPAPAPAENLITGGQATWFTQNGVAGACGTVHSDSDFIAAIDQDRYGNSGGASPLCGRQVLIINANDESKTVTVTIADDCPTCANGNSIDLSTAAFQQLASLGTGVVPIKWKFVS